jgi:non-canonical (house-cleaning) NTP pyrophosphatase
VVPRFGSTPERVCVSCFNTVMYNPQTAMLGDFEEEDLKAKLYDATIRVAVAATEAAKIQSTIQGISLAVTGSVLGKEVDAFGVDVCREGPSYADSDGDAGALEASNPTLLFARNQAYAAYAEYERQRGVLPHFSIAFETGIDRLVDGTNDFFTWVVIFNGKEFGSSRSQSFLLPPSIMTHLQNTGMQKRDAEKIIFGSLASLPVGNATSPNSHSPPKSPSRSSILNEHRSGPNPATPQGAIAHLLHGKMTWSRHLEPSVVLAFLPFQWQELYSVVEL